MDPIPFDPCKIKATSKVFPDSLESDSQIVFHGSSCAYALRIESHGFELNCRPWQKESLVEAANVIRSISPGVANDLESWAKKPIRLSFARQSRTALGYVIDKPGGQTLSFLNPYINELRKNGCEIVKLLDSVNSSDGCVYAVSLRGIGIDREELLRYSCYVSESVPPSAIIAKVVVPKETQLSDVITLTEKKHNLESVYSEMRQKRQQDGTA